jgi:hypothetical protein
MTNGKIIIDEATRGLKLEKNFFKHQNDKNNNEYSNNE